MYLSDSWTDSVDKLGGKAIGLNKLLAIANDTFQVPPFTVLTAESFLLHISGRGLQFNHTHDFSNEQIGQILDHILYGDIPADIVSEVEQWFEKAKKPLCVRSSCVSEDGETSSRAGLYNTFLNISTRGDLWRCIRNIWASVFSAQHIAYCKKIGEKLTPMAIIIQEMKEAAVSGVVFSDEESMIIRATYGLGVGIVNGSIKSDLWELDKTGTIIHTEALEKRETQIPNLSDGARYSNMWINYRFFEDEEYILKVIQPDERHAVLKVELPKKLTSGLCLSPPTINKIFETAEYIKKNLDMKALDMEWCLDGEKNLYVLQARPLVARLSRAKSSSGNYNAQPISGKTAYGRLCLINEPEDIAKLDKDKIAVMNWMPDSVTSVFMKSAGIIIKTWQNMSHFALLVREWEIPCIAAVEGCVLVEGAYVKIDGANGELAFLDGGNNGNSVEAIKKETKERLLQDKNENKPLWPLYLYKELSKISEKEKQTDIFTDFSVDNWEYEVDAAMKEYIHKTIEKALSNTVLD